MRNVIPVIALASVVAVGCSSSPGTAPTPQTSGSVATSGAPASNQGTGAQEPGSVPATAVTTDAGPSSAATTEAPIAGAEYSIAELLRFLPQSTDSQNFQISTGSIELTAKQAGLTRPPADADASAQKAFISDLSGYGPDAKIASGLLPAAFGNSVMSTFDGEFAKAVGWSFPDVDTFISNTLPPRTFTVMTGDFDAEAIDAAFGGKTDGIWAQPGEDLQFNPVDRTVDELGRAVRMAQRDDVFAFGLVTSDMTAWSNGTAKTMVDDPGALAVARSLDEAGVYAAYIVRGTAAENSGSTIRPGDQELQLARFDTLGVGLKVVDGRAVAVVVYHHPDAAAAAENVTVVPKIVQSSSLGDGMPISDVLELSDIVALEQNSVATFKVAADRSAAIVWTMLMRLEPLFIRY